MFNGIIKNTGTITKIIKTKNEYLMEVRSLLKLSKKEIGSSISCSGACLTLNKIKGKLSTFYISKETLNKSNFDKAKRGDVINLEKSLKFGDRISGHFIQGHVECTSKIKKISFVGRSCFINFEIQKKFKKYLIKKGSVAINGVSLTIAKITISGFQIVVIPYTLKHTNLLNLKEKDVVNIEFDILGKYIKKVLK